MSRKGSAFAGLSVAIVTPFKDGEIDFPTLKKQIDFQIAAGTDCLCPVGTTGESPTLSHEEHEKVIGEVIQHVAGRCKVMPGTGSNNTREALRLTRFAAAAGADAALVVAPYYNKPTQEGFYEHFKVLAEQVDLPICVYNIPGRTAKNVEPETIIRLGELEKIVMVKEATGSLDQCSQILNSSNLTILSGDDTLTLPMLSVGAEGVVSVVGNLVPEDVISMLRSVEQGNWTEAQAWHHKLFPLCRDLLGMATNPIPIKAAMAELGRDPGELRLPMTSLNSAQRSSLRRTLENYGLLGVGVGG